MLNARRTDGRRGHSKAVCALKAHCSMGRFVPELKNGKLRIDQGKVKTRSAWMASTCRRPATRARQPKTLRWATSSWVPRRVQPLSVEG